MIFEFYQGGDALLLKYFKGYWTDELSCCILSAESDRIRKLWHGNQKGHRLQGFARPGD